MKSLLIFTLRRQLEAGESPGGPQSGAKFVTHLFISCYYIIPERFKVGRESEAPRKGSVGDLRAPPEAPAAPLRVRAPILFLSRFTAVNH